MARIAVIGAGIGGLAVAGGLQRAGADVVVHERADELRAVGAGLSIFGNGFAALDALGLGDQVRELGGQQRIPQAGQRNPQGRWLVRMPAQAVEHLAVVHRAELQRVLSDALRPGTVRCGSTVDGVAADGRSITVRAGSGQARTEPFDLVIAADGIRSRVRADSPGDPGIRYAGYAAWRGVTSRPVDLHGSAGETWGRGMRFGMAPLKDGRVYWFAVATMPARTVIDDEYAAVSQLFAGWHEPIGELVAATPAEAVFRLDIEELAGNLSSFRQGRCVLLGDAAHAMTPDLGQGGNQALEDAATLVRLIGGNAAAGPGPWIDTALVEYDRLRRPRTQLITRQARLIGRVAQARGRVTGWLRDTVLRIVPAGPAARRAADLQDWQPPVPSALGRVASGA